MKKGAALRRERNLSSRKVGDFGIFQMDPLRLTKVMGGVAILQNNEYDGEVCKIIRKRRRVSAKAQFCLGRGCAGFCIYSA